MLLGFTSLQWLKPAGHACDPMAHRSVVHDFLLWALRMTSQH
jgi:hypothetical protein